MNINRRSHIIALATIGILITLCFVLLSASMLPTVHALGGATDQQKTIQAIINKRFTQTAQPHGPTQTAQARRDNALTATAAFNNTVDAQFNQLLASTAQASLPQTFTSPSGFSVRYPSGWLAQKASIQRAFGALDVISIGNSQVAIDAVSTTGVATSLQPGQVAIAITFEPGTALQKRTAVDTLKLLSSIYQTWQFGTIAQTQINGLDAAQEDISSDVPNFQALLILYVLKGNYVFTIGVTAPGELEASRALITAIAASVQYTAPILPTSTPTTDVQFPANVGSEYADIPFGVASDGPGGSYPVAFPYLGSQSAPVKIEQISSFSCPYCQQYYDTHFVQLIDEIKSGHLQYIFIPTTMTGDFDAVPGTEAAYCAMQQGRFWPMYDILFDWQKRYGEGAADPAWLEAAAKRIGLGTTEFDSCISDPQTADFIKQANDYTNNVRHLVGTPSVFVWVNGKQVKPSSDQASSSTTPGSLAELSVADLRRIIDQAAVSTSTPLSSPTMTPSATATIVATATPLMSSATLHATQPKAASATPTATLNSI